MAEAAASSTTHPWADSYPGEIAWDMAIPFKPVYALLDDAVARAPESPAIDFLGRHYSFRDLGRLVARAAAGFQRLGVGKGTRVGLFLPNTPYYVICYHAILKAGGTVVNFNPLYAEREVAAQIEDSGTAIMVTLDLALLYPKVAAMLDRTGLERVLVCRMADILPFPKNLLFPVMRRGDLATIAADDRHLAYRDLIDNDGIFEPPEIEPVKDVAVLQYTGGTTGVPKGAMLTHANLYANAVQVGRWFVGYEHGREKVLGVLPLFHVFAMTAVMNWALYAGAAMILLPRFDLRQVLTTIHKKRPTSVPGVPTLFTAINNDKDLARYDLSSIKVCISGGAPLPLEVRSRFESLTGCYLVEGYGLSETAPVATCHPVVDVEAYKENSIGIPMPGTVVEIRALDDPKMAVPTGEKGEICIGGPQVMAGYWNRPEETADAFVGGLFRTGDVGYMDEDGYIYIVDRLKEVILSSGYNVYPRNIEEAIHMHPAVRECAVVGVPDDYKGQAVKAYCALAEGATLTAEELIEFLRDKLSPMEMPKQVAFRDELPKSAVGKILKRQLLEEERRGESNGA